MAVLNHHTKKGKRQRGSQGKIATLNHYTKEESSNMTVEQLQAAARRMRAYNIVAIHCAGSGHPGSTLSIMDIASLTSVIPANSTMIR